MWHVEFNQPLTKFHPSYAPYSDANRFYILTSRPRHWSAAGKLKNNDQNQDRYFNHFWNTSLRFFCILSFSDFSVCNEFLRWRACIYMHTLRAKVVAQPADDVQTVFFKCSHHTSLGLSIVRHPALMCWNEKFTRTVLNKGFSGRLKFIKFHFISKHFISAAVFQRSPLDCRVHAYFTWHGQ